MNIMDKKNQGHRINHVRHYSFENVLKALKEVIEDRSRRAKAIGLFPSR